MPKIQEELLHFIWKNKLLKPGILFTHSGNEVLILKFGELNVHSGPDFYDACIKINNVELYGNIELHVKSSDWLKHKHEKDKAYDNLILHVVYEHDVELEQNIKNHVEVLELKNYVSNDLLEKYKLLLENANALPCAKQLRFINDIHFVSWIERMSVERLEKKAERVNELYTYFKGDYAQTFYTLLLRNYGFHVNALPFELIAKQLPLTLLLKHSDNLLQLEALLIGISGLLDNQYEDSYILQLQNEFEYLKTKYNLIPLNKELFKFSKLRPANFPNLRLAQFAVLIYKYPTLLQNPHLSVDFKLLKAKLSVTSESYWQHHYTIDGKLHDKELLLGEQSIQNIIVNTFAPFFFFYSTKTEQPYFKDLALVFLESCSFEQNSKTKFFSPKKNLLTNASCSQGLINLYDNYCSYKQCLKCGIALSILKN